MTEKPKPKSPKNKPAKASVLGSLPATRPTRLSRYERAPAEVETAANSDDAPPPVAPAAANPRAIEPAKQAGTSAASKTPAPRRRSPAKAAGKGNAPKTTAKTRAAKAAAEAKPPASDTPAASAPPEVPTPEVVATPVAADTPEATETPAASAPPAATPETPEAITTPATTEAPATTARTTFEPALAAPPKPHGRPRPVRSGLPSHGTTERRGPLPPPDEVAGRGTKLVTTAIRAAGELAQIGITVGGQLLKRTLDRLPKP